MDMDFLGVYEGLGLRDKSDEADIGYCEPSSRN
jgi:hypothetical protein